MVKRKRPTATIGFRIVQPVRHRSSVIEKSSMCEQHSLRGSGRTRRVLNVHDHIRVGGYGGRVPFVAGELLPGFMPEPDDVLQFQSLSCDRFVEDGAIVRTRITLPQNKSAH